MNLNKPAVIKKLQERFRNVNAGRGLYTAFLVPTMLTMFSTRAFAADTIWTKASAIMQDVYTQILGISTIAAVVTAANILNRLVNGSAKTFNQHTNVQLDNLYTVLDISELTGELLPVGMFVALDYVWDKAKEDRTKEKAIFIDEAWELIGDDDTNNPNNTKALAGEWVQEIFKIIRGYGGAAIAATQDIGDLDRSRFGKGILNVAKTKIILNLENDEAQRVQHILHLSDAEIMSITRFERGQGLISTNSNHITVSFKASPLEKQLITTDRMELNQILKEKIAQNTHNVVE